MFPDPVHDEFAGWALGFAPYGGADVGPLVDAALRIDVVDPKGIVFEPWSLGGYMAPRAAAFEHRLAAVVCDPEDL
jgi:hypothetical protein